LIAQVTQFVKPDDLDDSTLSAKNCLEQFHLGLIVILADFVHVIFEANVNQEDGPGNVLNTQHKQGLALICQLILPNDFEKFGDGMAFVLEEIGRN